MLDACTPQTLPSCLAVHVHCLDSVLTISTAEVVAFNNSAYVQEAARAPAIQHGSANAHLAAALSAGDFCAPESPPPVSTRPVHMVRK